MSAFEGEIHATWRSGLGHRILCVSAQASPVSLLAELGKHSERPPAEERLRLRNCALDSTVLLLFPEPIIAAQLSPAGMRALALRFAPKETELAKWPGAGLCWTCPLAGHETVTEGVWCLQSLTRAVLCEDGSEALAKRIMPRLLSKAAYDRLRRASVAVAEVEVQKAGQPSLYALWRRPHIQELVTSWVRACAAAGSACGTVAEPERVLSAKEGEHVAPLPLQPPAPAPTAPAASVNVPATPSASPDTRDTLRTAAEKVQLEVQRRVANGVTEGDAAAEAWAMGGKCFREGRFHDAVVAYSRSLEAIAARLPEAARAEDCCWLLLSNRAAARLQAGDADGALEDADRCIAANASFAKGHYRRCCALMARAGAKTTQTERDATMESAAQAARDGLARAPGDAALQKILEQASRVEHG